MKICVEEEILDFLDFPGPSCKFYAKNLDHFCGHGNSHNGSSDSLEFRCMDAEQHDDVQRRRNFDFQDFPGFQDPLCKFYAENLDHFEDTRTPKTVRRSHFKFGIRMQQRCATKKQFLISWIFLDPGIHFVNFMLKLFIIFVVTLVTVRRIHLKFCILIQNNMQMCNEDDFPGFQDPLCRFYTKIFTIFEDTGTPITVRFPGNL